MLSSNFNKKIVGHCPRGRVGIDNIKRIAQEVGSCSITFVTGKCGAPSIRIAWNDGSRATIHPDGIDVG